MEDILLHNKEVTHSLSSEGIFRLLKSAIEHAEKLNVSVSVSVLDKSGRQKIAQLMASNKDEIVIIEGGRPILFEENLVGAIGVSGATSAQDDEIAGAALANYAN